MTDTNKKPELPFKKAPFNPQNHFGNSNFKRPNFSAGKNPGSFRTQNRGGGGK